jgi:hypothetical protein
MMELYSGKDGCFRALDFTEVIKVVIVDTVEIFDGVLDYLLTQEFLAFDVEFCQTEKQNILEKYKDNWPAYKKLAASIQIASCEKVFWIDAIKLHNDLYQDHELDTQFLNLDPTATSYKEEQFKFNLRSKFRRLLSGDHMIRAFHSCESDVKVLYNSYNVITDNILDSSRATKFLLRMEFDDIAEKQAELKIGDQNFGLSDLAKLLLDIKLDKSM